MRYFRLSILALMLGLCSCGNGLGTPPRVGMPPPAVGPMEWRYFTNPPKGPPGFRAGWLDACHNALVATTDDFYRQFYSDYRLNYELYQNDPDYNIGVQVATWICGRLAELHQLQGSSDNLVMVL